MNTSFLNILQSIFGCLVDYRLRNIHLNICGVCQADFREFHSVFSVILLGFRFYCNDKNPTEPSTGELPFLPCILLCNTRLQLRKYGGWVNNRTFNQIFNLTSSLLMVEHKQQSPNLPNECKANDYQLSFREYRPPGMTTRSFAAFAAVPKPDWDICLVSQC